MAAKKQAVRKEEERRQNDYITRKENAYKMAPMELRWYTLSALWPGNGTATCDSKAEALVLLSQSCLHDQTGHAMAARCLAAAKSRQRAGQCDCGATRGR
jgi:hypothetical protein